MAFSSESCLALLSQAHEVTYIDGTFKTSPKLFKHIWIVRGHVGTTCVPLMYFLIEETSCPSYSMALQIIKAHFPDFDSAVFIVDFEKSEHSALRTQFPIVVIKGCLFHWKQFLLRRFRKLPGYADNESMKSNLHAVYGLAFVPVDDVSIGWTCLKSLLIQYTATLDSSVHRILRINLAPPLAQHHSISYQDVESLTAHSLATQEPTTSLKVQTSNNALHTAAGCASPTIPRLMDILCRFNAEAELKILQTSIGLQATRKPRNKVIKQNERIRRTVEGYTSANIVTYCRSLGYLHGWTQFYGFIWQVDYIWLHEQFFLNTALNYIMNYNYQNLFENYTLS